MDNCAIDFTRTIRHHFTKSWQPLHCSNATVTDSSHWSGPAPAPTKQAALFITVGTRLHVKGRFSNASLSTA